MGSADESSEGRRDPLEGVDADGMIRTGVDRAAVRPVFEAVLADAVESVPHDVELHLYGSVATGRAAVAESDVDLLAIGLDPTEASRLSAELTARYASLCRDVAIGAVAPDDLTGDGDEAYGYRVFLRHYCVQLSGPPRVNGPPFAADHRAARGFNGDIARHRARWLADLGETGTSRLARVVARKTLLALAGIVSIRESTWTTNRAVAAGQWARIEPDQDDGVGLLTEWSQGDHDVALVDLQRILTTTVAHVTERFEDEIGLWS